MDVTFIGSGNVAWHLAPALDNTGFAVREIFNRSAKAGRDLVKKLYHANYTDSLDFRESPSSVFFITTSDDAIDIIASEIILPDNALVVHTSGTRPLSILEKTAATHAGVFYPLQSFSKGKPVHLNEVPLLLESTSDDSERILVKMARSISQSVQIVDSEQRQSLHLAAVIASNFTNHMLTISKQILEENKLTLDILHPLIIETINKALEIGPERALTGPARRGDLEILDKHMNLLNAENQRLYRIVSQHILDLYQRQE